LIREFIAFISPLLADWYLGQVTTNSWSGRIDALKEASLPVDK